MDKIIYISIPKTGSSSVSLALNKKAIKDNYQIFHRDREEIKNFSDLKKQISIFNESKNKCILNFGHISINKLQQWGLESKQYYVFSFVRNPYSRIISIYNGKSVFKQLSFESFCEKYLIDENKKDYDYDLFGKNQSISHIKPQHLHVNEHTNVFKLEKRSEQKNSFFLDLSEKENIRKEHKLINPIQNSILEKINDFYKEDFIRFNYHFIKEEEEFNIVFEKFISCS